MTLMESFIRRSQLRTGLIGRGPALTISSIVLCLITLPAILVHHNNCLAASSEAQATSEKRGLNKPEGSPEKLFEAISGYYEGLHRRPHETSVRSRNGSTDQKRDPKRIVALEPEKTESVNAELDLARRRIQRNEWELAAISLKRAKKLAAVADQETIQALTDRADQKKQAAAQKTGQRDKFASETTNSIGMRLVLIPAGNFRRGSSPSEIRRVRAEWNIAENLVDPETPDHVVEISRPFLVGKYEVTVGQFKQFVAETGYKTVAESQGWGWGYDDSKKHWVKKNGVSWKTPGFTVYDDHPVVMVCHVDAEAFCSWLSSRDGRKYGLPTEAQWEYAARGGRQEDRFPWGNNYPDGKKLNLADRSCVVPWADRSINDLNGFTSAVGTYEPNEFKLYDMAGNAWELCSDYFDPKEYKKFTTGVTADPSGPKTGKTRVVRGGSWAFDACEARNAFRFGIEPKLCVDVCGFRVMTARDSVDRELTPVSRKIKPDLVMTDDHAQSLFERVKELVEDGKRQQARNLVDKIPNIQGADKGCLEDSSGFVKNVLNMFIDQNSNKSMESFSNSLGMRMVRIPEGSFVMGSSEADISWAMNVLARSQPISLENEYPFHKVRISKPFFMSTNPVTVEQFKTFVNETGYVTDAEEDKGGQVFDTKSNRFVRKDGSSWRNPGWQVESNQPVTMITYNDATAFCEWLAAKERAPYKLPTEAQWEYAARGGRPFGQFPWGDQLPDGRRANYADKNTDFEWRDRDADDGHKNVAPVGSYEPNGYGLNDMAGNVLQWVRDFYVEDYYRFTPEIDPEGPGQGENRVMKGGDWTSGPVSLRSAFRGWARPDLALYNGGFRVIVDSSSAQRPFHFSENFLTQEWVPNPDHREVAKAVSKEKERSVKSVDTDAGSKPGATEELVTRGILIMEFTPKSDAKKIGLIKGDVIIEYDGVLDLDSDKLIALTARTKRERRRPVIKIVRDGSEHTLQAPPGSLGISIMDTVLRGSIRRHDPDDNPGQQDDRDNKAKKKQWT